MEEQFLSTGQTLAPTSWSADGRFLMYMSIDPKTDADIWVLPMSGANASPIGRSQQETAGNAGNRKPFVFLKPPFAKPMAHFRRDGRWVAYHSNESGRPEIYVRPFVSPGATGTAAGGQWQVSTAGGILPLWRSDGKRVGTELIARR